MLVAGAIVVAAALFLMLKDGGGTNSGATTSADEGQETAPAIQMRGGEPVGGPRTLRFVKGERVVFTVIPDGSIEEVHVHGYDISMMANGSKPLKFSFDADLEGSYEIEAHAVSGAATPVATLEVRPR